MSYTFLRQFRHSKIKQINKNDISIINKLCIHCSVIHKQNDDISKPANLVGPPQTLKSISKEDMITRAMKVYMERKRKTEAEMEVHKAEYDLGRRHLANIMGVDEEEMTQKEVRKAIAYLLPSGLHNKMARPLMEPPSTFVPFIKGHEFNHLGRPYSFLFYTLKPMYYEFMHDMAWRHERIKRQVLNEKTGDTLEVGVEWISIEEFSKMFPGEKITEQDYNNFLILVKRLYNHAQADHEKAFFDKFLRKVTVFSANKKIEELAIDKENREYVVAKGKRKCSTATVKLMSHGHGHFKINGQDITYFKEVIHRQAVLAPLLLCGMLDKFDVEAHVESRAPMTGPSADAGAIRLGVAKALVSFVSDEMNEQLRIAGYLTSDPRMRERKKPGQEKARKKFTWKAR